MSRSRRQRVTKEPKIRVIAEISTPYNDLRLIAVGERIEMEVQGAIFATWHPRHLMTGYSWDALTAASMLRSEGPPRSVLLLGIGGGTVARQLRFLLPDVRITGVDVDAGVVDLARRHMSLDGSGMEIVIEDAYRFLESTPERFDAILDDAFLTGPTDVVRPSIPAGENLDLLKSRLAPGGILAANLITDEGSHRIIRRKVRKAFAAAFPSVRVIRTLLGLNEIVLGGEGSRPGSALRPAAEQLEDFQDRRCWEGLEVRLLPRRG